MPKINTDIAENKKFSYVTGIAFLFLGAIVPLIKGRPVYFSLLFLSILILFLGQMKPQLLTGPRLFWIRLGTTLGKINSTLIYSFIYIVLFSAVHFIFMIIRRDKMLKKWKKYSSTFKIKETISDFRDPF